MISAKYGGRKEINEDNFLGLLFEPGNEKDLVSKTAEIVQNPNLIKNIGNKGLEVFKAKFSEGIYLKRLCEIIQNQ